MTTQNLFSVRFDERTKQVLCALLDNAITQTSNAITAGDYTEELLQQHEELLQVKRGILYTRPEEVAVESPEEPVPTEEEVATPKHGLDATGGVEMYKSQGRTQ